jgi:hypothetical protein
MPLSPRPIAWTGSEFIASGKLFNLPAVLIVAAVSGLLYVGVTRRPSSTRSSWRSRLPSSACSSASARPTSTRPTGSRSSGKHRRAG